MRISELVSRSGVPLASVKYYLREGLLMVGEATSATQAEYGEQHVRRLALIRALTDVAGLPVQRAREVIALIDSPPEDTFEALGCAIAALPPYPDRSTAGSTGHPRALRALERIGQVCDPEYPAVAQLERALAAAESAGMPISDERLDVYAAHIRAIAEYDIQGIPATGPGEAIEYAVLGTALYEPVLAALRRVAHQDIARGRTDLPRP